MRYGGPMRLVLIAVLIYGAYKVFGGVNYEFRCFSRGREAVCRVGDTQGHSFRLAALTEKAPSQFRYGSGPAEFRFQINGELTTIELRLDPTAQVDPFVGYAMWMRNPEKGCDTWDVMFADSRKRIVEGLRQCGEADSASAR